MAQTARAYAPQRRYEEQPRPRIEVHTGQGRRTDTAAYARTVSVFKLAMVLVAVVAAVCIGRIFLVNASMETLTQAHQVNMQLDEARAIGTNLEARYYTLTNSTNVKPYAAEQLGMVAASAEAVTYIDLTPDFLKASAPQVISKAVDAQATLDARLAPSLKAAQEPAPLAGVPAAGV